MRQYLQSAAAPLSLISDNLFINQLQNVSLFTILIRLKYSINWINSAFNLADMHSSTLSDAQNIPSKHNYCAAGILGPILSKRGYQEIWDVNNATFIDPNKYLTPASSLFSRLNQIPGLWPLWHGLKCLISLWKYFLDVSVILVNNS